jgi:hypothetical protein
VTDKAVPMAKENPLGNVYTADEAAARLRINKRALIRLGRNIGACSCVGRNYLFSENDILVIWQEMRAPPIQNYGRATHQARIIKSEDEAFASLRRIAIARRQRRSA